MKFIPICYSVDKKYIRYLIVSIMSAEKYNNNLIIYIIHENLLNAEMDFLKSHVKSKVIFIDVKVRLNINIPEPDMKSSHLSKEALFRLLIPKLIKSHEKIIYLDVDTMVRDSLEDLFNINLKNFPFAAVPWFEIHVSKLKEINMKIDQNYFNSGVMLLNLQNSNLHEIFEKAINIFNEEPHKKFAFADQDILNSLVQGKFKSISEMYNYTSSTTKKMSYNRKVKIVHFAGKDKPNICFKKHPFKKEFQDYYVKIYSKKCEIDFNYIKKFIIGFFNPVKIIKRNKLIKLIRRTMFFENKYWISKHD